MTIPDDSHRLVEEAVAAFGRGELVVVADDDAGWRRVVRGLLDGVAAEVIEAADGEQALAVVAARPVDLVLADLRMPRADGLALLAGLPPGIPAIVITSVDTEEIPPRVAVLLRKDQLTAQRLAYAISRVK